MEIRKKLLAAYAFFAVIAAIWSWFSIRGMYRGSLIFMQKIHQGVCDPFSLHAMTAAAAILAAAFLASLFLFVRSFADGQKKIAKATAELAALTALLFLGNVLFGFFVPPTKLMIAIAENRPEEYIAKAAGRSFNINAVREGYTAFTFAVFNGADPAIIKILASNGADVNETMPANHEPACIAFLSVLSERKMEGEKETEINAGAVRALIENGMDVNAETYTGSTPLTSTIGTKGSPEITGMLIKAGADINHQAKHPMTGEKGVTPLILASFKGINPEIAGLLLKNGADANIKTGKGATALISAANHDDNILLVKNLIGKGADVNAKTVRGTTALMAAARNNQNARIIKILLEAKADAKAKDNEGKTALDYLRSNTKMGFADKKEAEEMLKRRESVYSR